MDDFYQVLGVDKTSSPREIKAAYRDLVKRIHPDVNKSADAARHMQALNQAYEVLSDPIKKAEYDQMRDMADNSSQVEEEQRFHVACEKCGKVDASLRVSVFTTVWSFIVFSFYKSKASILCAKCRAIASLKYNLQILVFGWWGFPFGILWSFLFLGKNSLGGHQAVENNAVLLATVGRNLIDAGDFIEAEKALLASLRLKESEYAEELLKIAKSNAGYDKNGLGAMEKLLKMQGPPLIYNTLLFTLIACIIVISLTDASDWRRAAEVVTKNNSGNIPKKSMTDTLFEEADKQDQSQEKASNNVPDGLMELSWIQQMQCKVNILRGERWNLPINIGDSREHVYTVLGQPTSNNDATVAATHKLEKHIDKNNDDSQIWSEKGLCVDFKNDAVYSVTAVGAETWLKTPFDAQVVYGITTKADLPTLFSKLGKPYTPNKNDRACFGGTACFEWRVGNLQITRSVLTTDQNNGKKHYVAGSTWGGVCVQDLRRKGIFFR